MWQSELRCALENMIQTIANPKTIAAKAELETINMVLHSVKFNKTKAAKKIGVDRKTLYNKTMKHKISKLPDKNQFLECKYVGFNSGNCITCTYGKSTQRSI